MGVVICLVFAALTSSEPAEAKAGIAQQQGPYQIEAYAAGYGGSYAKGVYVINQTSGDVWMMVSGKPAKWLLKIKGPPHE